MASAAHGDTVRVHYTGKLDDGSVFDSSRGGEPLEFTIGSGQVISGFDQAVTGLDVGQSRTVRMEAAEAYGERDEDLVLEVGRDMLPSDLEPKVGESLMMQEPGGGVLQVVVTEVSDTAIVLDANHPLAGKALTFDVELVEIVP